MNLPYNEPFYLVDIMTFVFQAHQDQKDKAGEDYFESHLLPVAMLVPNRLFVPALAHDILEDTDITVSDLEDSGFFGDYDITLIRYLTHTPGQDYDTYITNLRPTKDAVTIKIADIRNNLHPARLSKLDTHTQARLRQKYAKALMMLFRLEDAFDEPR